MECRVTFYQTEEGQKPVAEFLEALRSDKPVLHELVTAGLRKLKQREYHGEPLTTPVADSPGILELRVERRDIARVFFFFRANQEIVCSNGHGKKTQKLDSVELGSAIRYKADWERRFP